MTSLFEDLKEGLEEAIAYEKGNGTAKKTVYTILPVIEYGKDEIKKIRMDVGMTQDVFAQYMGVSVKTVEAWENGRNHPTGPAFRLMYILEKGDHKKFPFLIA